MDTFLTNCKGFYLSVRTSILRRLYKVKDDKVSPDVAAEITVIREPVTVFQKDVITELETVHEDEVVEEYVVDSAEVDEKPDVEIHDLLEKKVVKNEVFDVTTGSFFPIDSPMTAEKDD